MPVCLYALLLGPLQYMLNLEHASEKMHQFHDFSNLLLSEMRYAKRVAQSRWQGHVVE